MSLQNAVEKTHQLKWGDKEALHSTVMEVWVDVVSKEAFKKVFEKLNVIHDKILEDRGGNDMFEDSCGKKKDDKDDEDGGEDDKGVEHYI